MATNSSDVSAEYTQEKWPRNTERSHDSDSIGETISSVDTQHDQDHEALDKTLTARASRVSDHMSLSQRVTTIPTNMTADPNYEVDWDGEDDPENPKNWTISYKAMGLLFLSWNTLIM